MDLHHTLICAEALAARLAAGAPSVLLDCRFDLSDPSAGLAAYAAAHLPGARYAHLDQDLSGAKTGRNGRHPLPDIAALAAWAGAMGIAPGVQVVAYDDVGGPYAARCWWLLRWLGHDAVAVLDGGVSAWRAIGGAIERGAPASPTATAPYPAAAAPAMPTIDADALLAALGRVRLVDARSAARFRGEAETLDPVAGRIPGATLRAFQDNLLPNGRFKPAAQLRAEFENWATPAAQVVHQCGSGVTACHNLLAMAHAGLEGSVLYPGSWSEWCADPARPIARG
jgi:thiosulfate/3-mercaptopyruvate sulfurtransferase